MNDPLAQADTTPAHQNGNGFLNWVRSMIRPEAEATLRETIDEYINNESTTVETDAVARHERLLLSNILKLRDMTVKNVMIPRANIVAIEISTTPEDLLALLAEKQYSRFPVYRGTMDEVLGTVHIKDVLAALARRQSPDLKSLIREIPIVSPALPVIDLVITMRQSKRHMALVVDEFGGIDGLVTVNDVLEAIIGEIEDEHDTESGPGLVFKPDGSVIVDARLTVQEFEEKFGDLLNEEEYESAETVSGLVSAMAGRIPARGELINHESGMVFEILDADPRRINLLRIRNIPKAA